MGIFSKIICPVSYAIDLSLMSLFSNTISSREVVESWLVAADDCEEKSNYKLREVCIQNAREYLFKEFSASFPFTKPE